MKLKVENFGKIKSACIELNGYSIFEVIIIVARLI